MTTADKLHREIDRLASEGIQKLVRIAEEFAALKRDLAEARKAGK